MVGSHQFFWRLYTDNRMAKITPLPHDLKKPTRAERGQSLMEMAVSVVVIVILLAGIVDLGRAIFTFISLRDAAQEGLTYAAIYPFPCNRIQQRIDDTLDNTPVTYRQVEYYYEGAYHQCAAADVAKVGPGTEVKITVAQTDFPITMPFLGSILGRQNIEIKAVITGSVVRQMTP